MNVLAVDPGGTTGIAEWSDWEEPWMGLQSHRASALPLEAAMATVHTHIASGRFDLVVFESFHITQQTLKKTRDGQKAIEFIGVGRYLCRCYGVEFDTQSPSDAFTFSTDAKLKRLGWRCPGPGDHAKSASKHLLVALVNRRQIDLNLLVS